MDISGWRIEDGVDFTFPAGTTIPAGGFRVVAQYVAQFQTKYGFAPLGPWTGGLANRGERTQLRSAAGLVDEVDYDSGFPWPTGARGAGQSMELSHPSLDNNLAGSWRAKPQTLLVPRGAGGMAITNVPEPAIYKERVLTGLSSALIAGTDVLALHQFHTALGSSDLLIDAELAAGSNGGTPVRRTVFFSQSHRRRSGRSSTHPSSLWRMFLFS